MTLQERIPAVVLELSLSAPSNPALDLARAVLASAGVPDDQITREEKAGICILKVFFEDQQRGRKFALLFRRLKISGLAVKTALLRPRDWLTRWKRDWKPSRLTERLDVVPVWCKEKYKIRKGRSFILMDTLLSFGTGLHETTQLVAQMIEDRRGRLASFMDIGTGTGILAMVAITHGAKKVLAIDIGDLSVQAAKDNFKVNGLKAVITRADISTFKTAERYDFVAANLVTQDLIDNGRRIIRLVKPGGYLAVSGISLENLPRFRQAFDRLPVTLVQCRKGKQWAGLLYAR